MFFFNDTATTEIYTLSLHDALPIWGLWPSLVSCTRSRSRPAKSATNTSAAPPSRAPTSHGAASFVSAHRAPHVHPARSEEHTSELQSRQYLVCRLLLEKKTKSPDLT